MADSSLLFSCWKKFIELLNMSVQALGVALGGDIFEGNCQA
jgi:hypothetical protein